jgi:signal transduction histidine kinase
MLSRIMFLHVLAVLVTAIYLPLVLYRFLNSDVEALQQRALQGQADAVAQRLALQSDGTWSLDLPASMRDQYSAAYGRYAYSVLDESGRVLFTSRKEKGPLFAVGSKAAEAEFFHEQLENRTIVGASLPKRVGERIVWVQVAEDLAHRDVLIDDVVANFFRNVALVTLPGLLLLLAADIVIFRRAVQPLLRASARAQHIGPTRIDLRLPIDDIPREIVPLVVAVNQALDRLEKGFRRQREFTADVAHELRTPLAVVRTRIDMLQDQQVANALRRDIEGMTRVVTQLLDAAELETLLVDSRDRADLREVCAEVVESLAPFALEQEKTIALTGAEEPVWIKANTDMLRLAVRNLVENALSHTPKGSDVQIVVSKTGVVSVQDEGEGVPLDSRGRIFERLWRGDRRRNGGAGLGLSIVKRIVDAHGAAITVENRPSGGADFSMRFSLAEDPGPSADGAVQPVAAHQ